MGTANALHTHGDGTDGGTDARTARHAQAGLLAATGATALDVRTGVLVGPGSSALLSGTTDTGPMTVAIAPHVAVTSRGAANGPYLGPVLTAATRVPIAAAPASGSRIDVVYVKQQDKTGNVPTPDAAYDPLYAVQTGQVGQGKPSIAAIPGAEELGTVTVAAGATSTNGTGITIANTARQTVPRNTPVPVRSQAERDALTGYDSLTVVRLDLPGRPTEVHDGTTWHSTRRPYRQLVKTDSPIVNNASWTRVIGHANATGAPGNMTGGINYSAGVLTVPQAGRYRGFAKTAFATNGTGERRIRAVRNGSGTPDNDGAALFVGYGIQPGSPAAPIDVSCPIDTVLSAGDRVEVQIYQNSGAGLALFSTTWLQAFHLSYEGPA